VSALSATFLPPSLKGTDLHIFGIDNDLVPALFMLLLLSNVFAFFKAVWRRRALGEAVFDGDLFEDSGAELDPSVGQALGPTLFCALPFACGTAFAPNEALVVADVDDLTGGPAGGLFALLPASLHPWSAEEPADLLDPVDRALLYI